MGSKKTDCPKLRLVRVFSTKFTAIANSAFANLLVRALCVFTALVLPPKNLARDAVWDNPFYHDGDKGTVPLPPRAAVAAEPSPCHQ